MIDIILLSGYGRPVAERLRLKIEDSRLHVHSGIGLKDGESEFEHLFNLVGEIFHETYGIIFIGAAGAIVRAIAPHLKDKYDDPPVVVVDVRGRYAISLLSAHEGGGNDLALLVSNLLFSEPVITTTSQAQKDLIIGVGCRKGVTAKAIIQAIEEAILKTGTDLSRVRLLTSVDLKEDEDGLREAATTLDLPLRFISSEEIKRTAYSFATTPLALEKLNLAAVAEPAALLGGRRTRLILQKTTRPKVTIAIAQEDCA